MVDSGTNISDHIGLGYSDGRNLGKYQYLFLVDVRDNVSKGYDPCIFYIGFLYGDIKNVAPDNVAVVRTRLRRSTNT